MTAEPAAGTRHVPALDGIRGLAVAAVLLFHGGVSWAGGGFLGVDAFFVLSGFLITSLLLGEAAATGGIGVRRFWARRARRLLPALLVVVAAVGFYAALVAPADTRASIRLDALATLGYVANWRFVAVGGSYFGQAGPPSPLLHAWSLAIEEQFYVVWPLVVLLLARFRRSARWVLAVAAGGAVASAGLMAVLHAGGTDTSRLYYGTDTRAQSVLSGAALAALLVVLRDREPIGRHVRRRSMAGPMAVTGVVGLLAAIELGGRLGGGSDALYRGGFAVFCLAVALVIASVAVHPTGVVARALSVPPLPHLGLISYGAYLWHWPVFLTLDHERTSLTGAGLLAVRLAVTVGLALASYVVVEQPIRRGGLAGLRIRLLTPAAAAAVIVAVLVATAGQPPSKPVTVVAEPVTVPVRARAVTAGRPGRDPVTPDRPVRVLLVGDSVGRTLALGLDRPARRAGVDVTDRTTLGCGVVRGGPFRYFGDEQDEPPQCETWPDAWQKAVDAADPDVVLVVLGRWEVMDRVHDGTWTRVGQPRFDRYLRSELRRAVTVLQARGAHVALATAPYYKRGERPDGGMWPEDEPARADRFNALVRGAAADDPAGVTIVDLAGRLAPKGTIARVIDGVQVRAGDGVHLTMAGGRWLAPWLLPQLRALAGVSPVPTPPTGEAATPPTTGARRR